MQTYKGINALSDFRKAKLLTRLQSVDKSIKSIDAEYIHLTDIEGKLSSKEDKQLQELVTYGTPFTGQRQGTLRLVVPRPGTISPWSTKATDIANNSGLTKIKRLERGVVYYIEGGDTRRVSRVYPWLHDRMTETVLATIEAASVLFETHQPKPLQTIPVLEQGKKVLTDINLQLGLALSETEIDYLFDVFRNSLRRDPTDVELMMFGQVNSEHARHKAFNASWIIDGQPQPKSLFQMIKNTYEKGGQDVLSAYHDNAAVIKGPVAGRFFAEPSNKTYSYHQEPIHSAIKVETHNHPTAISPAPGAATGVGGEIRDEAAAGRGAHSKMGLAGYTVSNLRIPGAEQPWEQSVGKPGRIASPLDIMLEAPIGGAGFANEFGRPNLAGYFRTYEQSVGETNWGYHKPIMIAGGLGNIRGPHVEKQTLPVGALIIQIGGPAMLIGLGGGSASSLQSGASHESLDFASVQRGNGEMQRRTNELIDACWSLGDANPIITIHDVGAGGLSIALPEIVHDSKRGAVFELRDIPSAEPGLSPAEIWSNESQERYVLGIATKDLARFRALCERERCPFAVVGKVTKEPRLVLNDRLFKNQSIDLPMEVLFGKPPKMTRAFTRQAIKQPALQLPDIKLEEAIERVLRFPAVGSKKFLITIGDRTVGGLVTRDQMVGPWQVPVSDVAVTATAFNSQAGEAMAMGERTPLAVIDAPAAARLAVGEAITNIAAGDIQKLSDIKLSANWMAAVGSEHEDERLFDSVKTVGEDFAPALGLTIPVGKDSMSMRTKWQEQGSEKSVISPISLIVTCFAPVKDTGQTLTPQLDPGEGTALLLIDLGKGQTLGGSALAQAYNQIGDATPDADAYTLKKFFTELTKLKRAGKILAYHDRSDGGLLTTVLEMAFASRLGLQIDLNELSGTSLEKLFNEELGVVIQVKQTDVDLVRSRFSKQVYYLGTIQKEQSIRVSDGDQEIYRNTRAQLESWWSETSYQLQKLRDNPESADQEFAVIKDDKNPGLSPVVKFDVYTSVYTSKPRVAIFREQGVNGQVEMAAAFDKAGFTSIDVHLNDIMQGKVKLDDFVGLAAPGGFSYGDVLGAGEGWAKSILFNPKLKQQFKDFFAKPDTFSLGACNGCQMLAALKEIIPGAASWPTFLKNTSEQFEARLSLVKLNDSPSILFKDMAGSILPIAIAHGEGRAEFTDPKQCYQAFSDKLVAMQYVDNYGQVSETYPANPNGSPEGITALTTPDGRATILMPHPERSFLTKQLSWHPPEWGANSPWFKIFLNAREWVETTKP